MKNKKIHIQSRSYSKTMAKCTGRDTSQYSLFSLDPKELLIAKRENVKEGDCKIREQKFIISKNTAILGNFLFELWQSGQKNENDYLKIENLSILSKKLNTTNYEIKLYLIYLGGFIYPIVTKDDLKSRLTITQGTFFTIKFNYRFEDGDDKRIENLLGSGHLQFIKNRSTESIEVKPNEIFIRDYKCIIRDYKCNGLGFVYVSDNFIKFCLELSDIAYKILCLSMSNKPTQKLKEENLIIQLGLEEQLKKQGKPRIREKILQGFEDLKNKKHIVTYTFCDPYFKWNYKNTIIKHQELQPKQRSLKNKNPYINFKDTSIPLIKIKKAYKKYLIEDKNYYKKRAEVCTEKFFKKEEQV